MLWVRGGVLQFAIRKWAEALVLRSAWGGVGLQGCLEKRYSMH